MTLLQINSLQMGYPNNPLFKHPLNASIPEGLRVGIIGANGSGKSTFIRTLMGLHPPLKGGFQWKQGIKFGYVPQETNLNPLFPLTVNDLCKMGGYPNLSPVKRVPPALEALIDKTLNQLEILPFKHRLTRDLSGGQRQRALIARSLIVQPQVLILDEPFSSLDHAFKIKLWDFLDLLKSESGLSSFLIDHDLNRVINHVDWIFIMAPQGVICGKTDDVISETNLCQAFQTQVKIHRQNDAQIQIHFI